MATPLSSALDLCKRIREKYSQEHLCPLAINTQQCMLLSNKILETENTLEAYQVKHKVLETENTLDAIQVKLSQLDITSSGFPNVGPATEELVHVLRAAHTTIFKDCFCNGRWMESALRQGGNLKETFAEIMYDLQWCMMVLRTIFLKWTSQDRSTPASWFLQEVDCDGNLSGRDNDSLLRAASQDQEDLKVRLRKLKGGHTCHEERCTGMAIDMPCLASQLLKKMEFEERFQPLGRQAKKDYHEGLYGVNGMKLTKWPFVVFANRQDLHKHHLLGEWSYGSVYEAEWLEESYAMKIPKSPSTQLLKQEIAAVAGVHHPHIMGLIFCAEDAKNSVFVMEHMDKSLFQMLRDQSSDNQPSLIGRVSVMLQIAEGMKHLHSKNLVHRDLKTDNILIKCDGPGSESSMLDLVVKPLWIAKICDFGTTKVKMDSTAYANQTKNIGSIKFMAPEVYKVQLADQLPDEKCYPTKADVYSFGLICFAVLTGEPSPFSTDEILNPSLMEFRNSVLRGLRPQLPPDCPDHLSLLIQQCWNGNPVERPKFEDICTKLRRIKGLLLTEGSSPEGGNLLASRASTSSSIQVEGSDWWQAIRAWGVSHPEAIRDWEVSHVDWVVSHSEAIQVWGVPHPEAIREAIRDPRVPRPEAILDWAISHWLQTHSGAILDWFGSQTGGFRKWELAHLEAIVEAMRDWAVAHPGHSGEGPHWEEFWFGSHPPWGIPKWEMLHEEATLEAVRNWGMPNPVAILDGVISDPAIRGWVILQWEVPHSEAIQDRKAIRDQIRDWAGSHPEGIPDWAGSNPERMADPLRGLVRNSVEIPDWVGSNPEEIPDPLLGLVPHLEVIRDWAGSHPEGIPDFGDRAGFHTERIRDRIRNWAGSHPEGIPDWFRRYCEIEGVQDLMGTWGFIVLSE